MSVDWVLVFSAVIGAAVGVLGVLVAVRERSRGSVWWAWAVPGAFGALLLVSSFLRLVGVAA